MPHSQFFLLVVGVLVAVGVLLVLVMPRVKRTIAEVEAG